MSAVEVFQFPATGHLIRTVVVDDEPWFVLTDVAAILGYRDAYNASRILDEDEKGTHQMSTPRGQQEYTVASEAGLFHLILRSDKPTAKPFRRWVTHDVLPALRRTGRYELAQLGNPLDELERQTDLTKRAIEIARQQSARAELAEGRVLELAPKAAQADAHRSADGLLAIGDFANRLKAWAKAEHKVTVKHEEVWDFLGEIGLIVRGNTVRHNQPTAMAVERDFVRTKVTEYETNNHGLRASSSSRLTPAGEGWAWDRAVRRIAEHGSLQPTKALART